MSSTAPSTFTAAEYLALDRASERKHEFVAGAIVLMAGARPAHNLIAARVTARLVALAGPRGCVTFTSDQRVHVPSTRLYAYPDVTVCCGERRYDDGDPPSLLNPSLIVEVTSDSTEDFDRGTKFIHYQAIPELREYLVVSHRERRLDHFRRLEDGQWHLTTLSRPDAVIALPLLEGAIGLDDAYFDVSFDEGQSGG